MRNNIAVFVDSDIERDGIELKLVIEQEPVLMRDVDVFTFDIVLFVFLSILFVFLRFHSFEIDPLSVDVTLQFLPVAGNPEFALVVKGEDVEIAIFIAHTTEVELFVVFKIVSCDDVLDI